MTNQNYQRIKKEIKQKLLEEFVLPILKNLKAPEGEYEKKFVNEILKAAKEKPIYTYNPKNFLYQIGSK